MLNALRFFFDFFYTPNFDSVRHIKSVHEFSFETLQGNKVELSRYKGKKVLLVNTASKCGFTYQYEGLKKLYEQNSEKLVVIAFPANNFLWQEPFSNKEIQVFCQNTFSVPFPISEKISVRGKDITPLFNWLIHQSNPDKMGNVRWNFEKFLIDEDGILIRRFSSKTEPLSREVVSCL